MRETWQIEPVSFRWYQEFSENSLRNLHIELHWSLKFEALRRVAFLRLVI